MLRLRHLLNLCCLASGIILLGVTIADGLFTNAIGAPPVALVIKQLAVPAAKQMEVSAQDHLAVGRMPVSNIQVASFQLLGESVGIAASPTNLFKTRDDGASWKDVTPPFNGLSGGISAVRFLDGNTGWVFHSDREDEEINTQVWRTVDGGEKWYQSAISQKFGSAALSARFIDQQEGWVLSRLPSGSNFNNGRLFHTQDGGDSWTELPLPPSGGHLSFVSADNGWILGGASGHDLFVTTDGGNHWSQQAFPVEIKDASLINVTLPELSQPGWATYSLAILDNSGYGYVYQIESSLKVNSSQIVSTLRIESIGDPADVRLVSATPEFLVLSGKVDVKEHSVFTDTYGKAMTSQQMVVDSSGSVKRVESRGTRQWVSFLSGGCRYFKMDCYQDTILGSYRDFGVSRDITPITGQPAGALKKTPLI
jgi:hypothetical protein